MIPVSQLSDAELSGMFAVKVAGWPENYSTHKVYGRVLFRLSEDNGLPEFAYFATSADAVLPWLPPGFHAFRSSKQPGDWCVSLYQPGNLAAHQTTAPTFPRAACIALLAAKGITEVES